jgi:GNAT superfamily N-acetyltransferase
MDIHYQISTNIRFNHVIEKTERFTFPPIRKKIQTMPIVEPYTGVWATNEKNQMLGLILADHKNNEYSELFSFYVVPGQRNKGIGTQLLSLLETALREQGIKWIQSRYRSDWPGKPVIEKMLISANWEKPFLMRWIIEFDMSKFDQARWPDSKLPSDYSLFPWNELTASDRDEIDILLRKKEFPREFDPYQHAQKIFLPGSSGLRYRGKIIGWNIVYSLKADTLEYNNLFIREDFRKLGHALSLLHQSFGIQDRLKIPKATWVINADNKTVMKFTEHIGGWILSRKVEVMGCRKLL